MKKIQDIFCSALVVLTIAFTATSCNSTQVVELPANAKEFPDSIFPQVFGKVSLALNTKVDKGAIQDEVRPHFKAEDMIVEFMFVMSDGSMILAKRYERYADIPSIIALPIGTYTVVAKSADVMADVQDAPHFTGQTSITVAQNANTLGAITCEMQNSQLDVVTDQAFKESFESWTAELKFKDSDAVATSLNSTDNKTKFVKPTPFKLHLEAIQVGDNKVFSDIIPVDEIRAAQNVALNLTATNNGTLTLSLSINGTIVITDHTINFPDTDEELGGGEKPTNPPTVVGTGFDIDQVKIISTKADFENGSLKNPLVVVISGPEGGGIQELVISIDSPDIGPELLVPIFGGTSFDLANVAPGSTLETNLNNLGILATGTQVRNTPSFTFDLTGFMTLLPENEITHNFTVKVKDGKHISVEKTIRIKRVK